jgi:hypothetical protein
MKVKTTGMTGLAAGLLNIMERYLLNFFAALLVSYCFTD